MQMSNYVLKGGLLLAALLAVASWIASAMGMAVNNLFSGQGLRWLLLHGLQDGAMAYWPHFILFMFVSGSYPVNWNRETCRRYLLRLLPVLACFVLLAFWVDSPLRGIGGGLFPSPLGHAGFVVMCLCLLGINLSLHSQPTMTVLVNALKKMAVMIILYPIFAFLYNEITYIWN